MNILDFPDLKRLLSYLEQHAVDSRQIAIAPSELTTLANCLIDRMILASPLLDEMIQEELDDLRYRTQPRQAIVSHR